MKGGTNQAKEDPDMTTGAEEKPGREWQPLVSSNMVIGERAATSGVGGVTS